MILDDQELLDRWVSQRDAEAFKDLAKRHVDMVFATCRRILGNDADAEDATQDCFIALIRARREPGSYLGPWLHRVATNMSLKRLRAEKWRWPRNSVAPAAPVPAVLATIDAEVPATASLPSVATKAGGAAPIGIPRRFRKARMRSMPLFARYLAVDSAVPEPWAISS